MVIDDGSGEKRRRCATCDSGRVTILVDRLVAA